MNKKGSVLDWFYIIPILFLIGIIIMVIFLVIDKSSEASIFTGDDEANNVLQITRNTVLSMDNLMLFIIVGLSLFVLVSAAMVANHPAFFIISFFLLCIAVMVAAVVSNSFWTFTNNANIVSLANHFPKIRFLMSKLPIYIAFMGIASLIAGYTSVARQ